MDTSKRARLRGSTKPPAPLKSIASFACAIDGFGYDPVTLTEEPVFMGGYMHGSLLKDYADRVVLRTLTYIDVAMSPEDNPQRYRRFRVGVDGGGRREGASEFVYVLDSLEDSDIMSLMMSCLV